MQTMQTSSKTIIDLETKFWQSMVDQDTDSALKLLSEPSLMVSPHGAIQFDHAAYRKMAEQGTMVVTSFKLKDVQVVIANDTTAIVTYGVTQAVANRGETASKSQDMTDSSTWIKTGDDWHCVMHTETPVAGKNAKPQ
jgi:hypothetical protein